MRISQLPVRAFFQKAQSSVGRNVQTAFWSSYLFPQMLNETTHSEESAVLNCRCIGDSRRARSAHIGAWTEDDLQCW